MTQKFMIRTWPRLAKVAGSVLLLAALDASAQDAAQPPPAPAPTDAPAKPAPAAKPATAAKPTTAAKPATATKPTTAAKPAPAAKPTTAAMRTNLAAHVPARAEVYYRGFWGVESLTVKYTESGEMIRFSYRVIDPEKAALLNDKKVEPSLIDPQAGVKLVVPQMEKIGQLRQSGTPVAGKSYWMAFSNSGRRVKPGHRVDVQIGNFRAQGLVVE